MTCRCQVAAGFAGFLGVRGLLPAGLAVTDLVPCDLVPCDLAPTGFFRAATGLMVIGRPAGVATASLGSGPCLKNARQPGESWDFLAIMQAVTRSTLGISELQSLNASGVQACSC